MSKKRIRHDHPDLVGVLTKYGDEIEKEWIDNGGRPTDPPGFRTLRKQYGLSLRVAEEVARIVKTGGLGDWRARRADPRRGDAPPDPVISDARTRDYVFDRKTMTYHFELGSPHGGPISVDLPAETVWNIRRDYSSVASNQKTVGEVSTKYGIRKNLVPLLLRAMATTHSDDPYMPEELEGRSTEDLLTDMETQRRQDLSVRWERRKRKMDQEDAERWRRREAAIRETIEDMAETLPKVTLRPPRSTWSPQRGHEPSRYAIFAGLADYHYGDRSDEESRSPYNLEIAERRLVDALVDVGEEIDLRGPPDIIYFALMGDILTADTDAGTTTRGTQQVLDGDQRRVRKRFIPFLWEQIMFLAQYGPVHVPFIPGNHDQDTLSTIAVCFELMVEQAGLQDRVKIIYQTAERMYLKYGDVGLALWHGHKAAPRKMPMLFAAEAPKIWGSTTERVAFHGHWHQEKSETYPGVRVRQLRSLAGNSKWANDEGFVGPSIGLDAFVIDHKRGFRNHIYCNPET